MEGVIDGWTKRLEAADPAGALRDEILIFPRGSFAHPEYGKLAFDSQFFQAVLGNFNRRVLGTDPFVDFQHQEGEAAGWIKGLRETSDGLVAKVQWTPLGQKALGDRIFRYFSPWWGTFTDERGNKYDNVLRGGALTNVPFLKTTLPALVAEDKPRGIQMQLSDLRLAEWTTAYVDDLPDSSFAVISPGGEKDEGGKTTPRSLRHLPYRDADGKIDLPHLRNALARVSQIDASPDVKARAQALLEKHAKEAGVGDAGKAAGEPKMDDNMKKVCAALGMKDDCALDDMLAKIKGLMEPDDDEGDGGDSAKMADKVGEIGRRLEAAERTIADTATKLEATTKRAESAERKLAEKDAESRVDRAIREGKLTRAMADGYFRKLALSDPAGFDEALKAMPKVWDGQEHGHAGGADIDQLDPVEQVNQLAEAERAKDQKLSRADALTKILNANPKLYRAYAQRTAVKV